MTIATLDDYYAAVRQQILLKIGGSNSAAPTGSCWAQGPIPAAGTVAVGNTANGLVPVASNANAVPINPFSGVGYLTGVDGIFPHGSALLNVRLYDRLFHAGAYAFNDAVTLASQPSFSSRVPGGTDYTGLQIWVEVVTGFTGVLTVAITYTDQDGNPGASAGTVTSSAPGALSTFMAPLASGDCGVQKIESVTSTVASAGTFNVFVARPLAIISPRIAYYSSPVSVGQYPLWIDTLGMPIVYTDSCLAWLTQPGWAYTTATGDTVVEIASN